MTLLYGDAVAEREDLPGAVARAARRRPSAGRCRSGLSTAQSPETARTQCSSSQLRYAYRWYSGERSSCSSTSSAVGIVGDAEHRAEHEPDRVQRLHECHQAEPRRRPGRSCARRSARARRWRSPPTSTPPARRASAAGTRPPPPRRRDGRPGTGAPSAAARSCRATGFVSSCRSSSSRRATSIASSSPSSIRNPLPDSRIG